MPLAPDKTPSSDWQSAIGNRQFFCWQGWSITVPHDWNPIKLEGDFRAGVALLADLSDAKLGLRWASLKGLDDPAAAARNAMIGEVGALAAEEARELEMPRGEAWTASLLYVEPDPPGRDVWVGVSSATGRLVQVVYHAKRRDRVLSRDILPSLCDTPADSPIMWAALDLKCVTPAGFKLAERAFAAGDLRMAFTRGPEKLTIRQIGPAELALARQPIEKWLAQHPLGFSRIYAPAGNCGPARVDGIEVLAQKFVRRRRFVMHWRQPREIVVLALHDDRRDRIVIVEGSSEELAIDVAKTLGGGTA